MDTPTDSITLNNTDGTPTQTNYTVKTVVSEVGKFNDIVNF